MRHSSSVLLASISIGVMLATGLSVDAQDAPKAAASAAAKGDAPKPAVATEPTVTTALYGVWTLRCVQMPPATSEGGKTARPDMQSCEIVQSVQVQGQAQPIAQVAIGHLPNDKELILTALLPVNIAIPGGVQVSGNGKTGADAKGTLNLAWQRCLGGACVASGKPDAATLAVFRKEEAGQLRFVDASGKMIGIPLSWSGLEQALDALAKKG